MGSEYGKRLVEQGNAIPFLAMYFDRFLRRAIPVGHSTPLPSFLLSEEGNPLSIDDLTRALITVDYAHHEVHEGSHYLYINAQNVAASTTIPFTIVTPNSAKEAHFGFIVQGEAEWDLQIFEGATGLTSAGTPVSNPAVVNNNRNSSKVNTTILNGSPILGGGSKGTLIVRKHAGASGPSAAADQTGQAGTGEEIILKRNTTYWIDLSNIDTGTNWLSWVVEWYEHTNPNG